MTAIVGKAHTDKVRFVLDGSVCKRPER